MKDIQVKITTKHFRNSDEYTNPNKCPLALAIKEAFSGQCIRTGIHVGFARVTQNDKDVFYSVTKKWCSEQRLYFGKWKGKTIDEMIIAAKADKKLKFPTKVLTLKELK